MTNDQPTSPNTVTIGGARQELGSFSAFKAFRIMDVISEAEGIYRDFLFGAAEFKQEFEKRNVVELDRVEARREFRPRPLYRTIRTELEDGRISVEDTPMVDDETGEPVLGADPLGHISEEDWKASNNVLRVGTSPSEDTIVAAMIPRAFKQARESVLRLLALVVVSNSDLERWDQDGDVDQRLEDEAKRLLHRAKGDELVILAAASLRMVREQIRGPFDDLIEEVRTTFQRSQETIEPTPDGESTSEDSDEIVSAAEPEPMRVETPTSPTLSTDSPDALAGTPQPSSTGLGSG